MIDPMVGNQFSRTMREEGEVGVSGGGVGVGMGVGVGEGLPNNI